MGAPSALFSCRRGAFQLFDGYIICGTPRSGSTLLCGLLASTKAAGDPDSFYRRQDIAWWAEQWRLPAADPAGTPAFEAAYLAAAIEAGKGGTPIFGLRLMHENLAELQAILGRIFPGLPSDTARFERAFGRVLYIHLSRENIVAQAISRVKAEQTGLWHVAPDGTEIERVAPPQPLRYDFEWIRREVVGLKAHDAAWNAWFAAHAITPLRVVYEQLSGDPAGTLARICDALGVPAPNARDLKPGVAILSDETSRDWQRRYLADIAAGGRVE